VGRGLEVEERHFKSLCNLSPYWKANKTVSCSQLKLDGDAGLEGDLFDGDVFLPNGFSLASVSQVFLRCSVRHQHHTYHYRADMLKE
jgi:hypothetical protein